VIFAIGPAVADQVNLIIFDIQLNRKPLKTASVALALACDRLAVLRLPGTHNLGKAAPVGIT